MDLEKEKQEKMIKLLIPQIPKIIDEEKRIVRIKASTKDFDRVDDRINNKGVKLAEHPVLFIDSHQSNTTIDVKMGEIIKAFSEGDIWYNDVQFDIPFTEDGTKWSEGLKRTERIWQDIKAKKNFSVSIGFLPVEGKSKLNNQGGTDFEEIEQYELSIVVAPCNPKAGTKMLKDIESKTIKELIKDDSKLEEIINDYFGFEKELTLEEQLEKSKKELEEVVKEKEELIVKKLELEKELETLKKVEEETPKIETKKSLFKKRGGENE